MGLNETLADPHLERVYLRSLIGDRTADRRVRSADVTRCQVPVGAFAQDAHAALYETILAHAAASRFIVDEELVHRLEASQRLRAVGGQRGLDEVLGEAWSAPSETQAKRLTRLWRLRQVQTGALAIMRAVSDGDLEHCAAAYSELGRTMDAAAVSDDQGETTMGKAFAAMLEDFSLGRIGTRITDPAVSHLRDPWLEAMAGSMVVIGGSTGSGKSSLCLRMVGPMRDAGMRPGVISLEDPEKVWGSRVGALYSGVSLMRLLREGHGLTHNSAAALNHAVDEIKADTTPLVTLDDHSLDTVLGKMRRLVTVHGCDSVFIDYLQLVVRSDMPGSNHALRMSRVAQDLKNQAKRLGVPLFLCSQLRRPDKGKAEPTIHDLKETGDLENMAEAVVLLWKESDEEDARTKGKVAKLKNGSARPRFDIVRGTGGEVARLVTSERALPEMASAGTFGRRDFND